MISGVFYHHNYYISGVLFISGVSLYQWCFFFYQWYVYNYVHISGEQVH